MDERCSNITRNLEDRQAFKLLTTDPNYRLIIYFHGNAGTVGQTRRTEAYRMISSGASEMIHVLAFDYRGFGNSTGSPTEEGLIVDAVSVILWAMDVAHIPHLGLLKVLAPLWLVQQQNTSSLKSQKLSLLALFSALPLLMLPLSF